MQKTLALVVFLIAVFSINAGATPADPFGGLVQEQARELASEDLDAFISNLDEELQSLLPATNWRRLLSGGEFDFGKLGRTIFQNLFHEFFLNSKLLGQLILLAVLCALLQNIQVFSEKGSVDVAFAVCFLVLTYIGLHSFQKALAVGAETIKQMETFMYTLLPVLSTSLAATGAIGSAALLHPMLIAVVELVALAVSKVVFPLLFCGAALAIVGNFSERFPVSRLAGLFQQATVVVLTLGFIAFLGVLAVRGSIAPVADGVTLRTAKYLAGTFIPVIGKMFADSVEVVVGGSLLIKSAVGYFGMVTVLVLVAFPLVKIASILVIYKLVTALIQPIADQRLVSALNGMGNALAVLFAAVGTVAVMFFVVITVLVGVGNVAVTIR